MKNGLENSYPIKKERTRLWALYCWKVGGGGKINRVHDLVKWADARAAASSRGFNNNIGFNIGKC